MSKIKNLTGRTFGRLTVIKRDENKVTRGGNALAVWECRCSCGENTSVLANSLLRNKTKSCGCLHIELAKQKGLLNKKHGGYADSTSVEDKIKFQALVNIRERAKRRGYESDLELSDLPNVPKICPVLGVKLVGGSLKNKDTSPSVDRKNSNLPYLKQYKSNLVFISHRANRIKSDATAEELKLVLLYMLEDKQYQ